MSSRDAGRREAGALKNVPAVARAHAVLDMVSACDPPLTVSEIARRLCSPRAPFMASARRWSISVSFQEGPITASI